MVSFNLIYLIMNIEYEFDKFLLIDYTSVSQEINLDESKNRFAFIDFLPNWEGLLGEKWKKIKFKIDKISAPSSFLLVDINNTDTTVNFISIQLPNVPQIIEPDISSKCYISNGTGILNYGLMTSDTPHNSKMYTFHEEGIKILSIGDVIYNNEYNETTGVRFRVVFPKLALNIYENSRVSIRIKCIYSTA
jgi:hypothetical protein